MSEKTERQIIIDCLERHALYYGACVAEERKTHTLKPERLQAGSRLLSEAERLYQYDAEVHPK